MSLAITPIPADVVAPRSVAAPRLVAIDYLRGVATLLVCFCHFQRSFPEALRPYVMEIGKTGVQIFFVISGFIIPYGLYRAGYRLTHIHRFYVKRLLRLHPPYLLALAVFFVISAVAVVIRGDRLDWAFTEVLKATVYLWIPSENPVFWTLIVELKYYLFISLAFPLFFGLRWLGTACIVLSAAVVFCAHDAVGILIFVPYFLLGFAAARCALGISRTCEMALLMVVVLAAGVTSSSPLELAAGGGDCAPDFVHAGV